MASSQACVQQQDSPGPGPTRVVGAILLTLICVGLIALVWWELKRHCASSEGHLWGYIKVPVAIRLMISPPMHDESDPYFTPINDWS